MRAAGPTHALGAGPDSELDPASKLDLVARGPDFSKEKHTTTLLQPDLLYQGFPQTFISQLVDSTA